MIDRLNTESRHRMYSPASSPILLKNTKVTMKERAGTAGFRSRAMLRYFVYRERLVKLKAEFCGTETGPS